MGKILVNLKISNFVDVSTNREKDLNSLVNMNLLAIKGPKTGKGRYYVPIDDKGDKGDIR